MQWCARQSRQDVWRWVAVTAGVTVFVIRLARSGKVAQELLGDGFWGYLVTDRWSAYTWYPPWRRRVCWAHLLGDSEAMIARGGDSRTMGEALRTLAPASFASPMRPIRRDVERRLQAGQRCGVPKTEGTCRALLTLRQALWTFVRHPEIEPTINAAERAIRLGVRWRKGSFGTQRADGSRFVEAMMTMVATLKQQHRRVLNSLTAVCEAALQAQPIPSLLPSRDDLAQLMRPAA
jgi:transposase